MYLKILLLFFLAVAGKQPIIFRARLLLQGNRLLAEFSQQISRYIFCYPNCGYLRWRRIVIRSVSGEIFFSAKIMYVGRYCL